MVTTHGVDLSQHRYQMENDCIFILDEAHEPTAITDNLKKVSTRIIFEFAQKTRSNILVTATPMQSENPQQQLWNFSKLLYRDNESKQGLGYQKIYNEWFKEKEKLKKIVTDRQKREAAYWIIARTAVSDLSLIHI